MNDVALRANEVLCNDVMLCINEVAFRANGIVIVCFVCYNMVCNIFGSYFEV